MQRGCSGTAQSLDALVDGMSETQFEKVLVVDLLPNRLRAKQVVNVFCFPPQKWWEYPLGMEVTDCCPGWLMS